MDLDPYLWEPYPCTRWVHDTRCPTLVSRNKGGAYIITELNGSVFDRPVAAFRVIPYFAHTSIAIPPLDEFPTFPDRNSFKWNSQHWKTQKKKMMTTHLRMRFLRMTEDSQE